MGRFEADVKAVMEGRSEAVIEKRKEGIEDFRRILWATPYEKREGIYKRLRELREELDVIQAVAS